MGRSHDYFCKISGGYWSPFDFEHCPDHGPGDCSFYDPNYEGVITHGEDGHPLPDTSGIELTHTPVEEDDAELDTG